MPIKHTRKELETRIDSIDDFSNLYNASFVNWSGYPLDSDQCYSEIIAEIIFKQKLTSSIQKDIARHCAKRTEPYRQKTHNGLVNTEAYGEVPFSYALLNSQAIKEFKMLDYQVPLMSGSGGKVDLLAKPHDSDDLVLIELKPPKGYGNDDTLLRAALEIYTYREIAERDKFRLTSEYTSPEARLQAIVLIEESSVSGQTAVQIEQHSFLKKLLQAMEVKVVTYCAPCFKKRLLFEPADKGKLKPIWQGNLKV